MQPSIGIQKSLKYEYFHDLKVWRSSFVFDVDELSYLICESS